MKRGAIQLSTLFWALGALATGMVWVISTVNTAIAPIKAEADENSMQINGIQNQMTAANVKLSFILGRYGAEYDPNTETVTTSTK